MKEKKEKLILGVDEAGRGPVIGPLVISGVLIKESKVSKLQKMGVKDSKKLTPKKRENLFRKIKNIAKYKIIKIRPKEIDGALASRHLNLNWLEGIKTARIINTLKPDKVTVDCPSPNKKAYVEFLKKHVKVKCEIIAEHKAERFAEVAAASIISKVTRDREIEKIKKKYGDVGPGYPSNPTTQKFLKENWEKHPEIFRKSWISWKNHQRAKMQKKLSEF